MKKFGNFINEDLIDKKPQLEPVKMIFSNDFSNTLRKIIDMRQSNISKRLLNLPEENLKFDISYVDIGEEKDSVTYLSLNRIYRLKKDGASDSEYWTTKLREKTKIGRFIKKIFGTKYSDDSINTFSNKFKTIAGSDKNVHKFEIVDGDDLIYWFNRNNYKEKIGTLGGSAMSYNASSAYLNMYSRNSNKCKMLILKDEYNDNKIVGRALLWILDEPEERIFMDRIFYDKLSTSDIFINKAKNENWLYKKDQIYGDTNIVMDKKETKIKMHVVLDDTKFKFFPFMDTLRYYYPNLQTIANHKSFDDIVYTLNDEKGRYQEYDGDKERGFVPDPLVEDKYNNVKIKFRDAVWCDVDNAYCAKKDVVFLSYKNIYSFPNSDKIVYSDYQKRYYLKDDCVWSKPLNSWIWDKYAVDVYHDKNRQTQPDKTHRFESNKSIIKIGDYWYDIDLKNVIE